MKYKIRTMLATGATITTLALTLGQTAWAQDDSIANSGTSTSSSVRCSQSVSDPADCLLLDDQLTFAQLQAKMLEKLTQNQSRLNEKLTNVDTLNVSGEVKAKMKDHITARLQDLNKRISQVQAATTKEELLQVRKPKGVGARTGLRKALRNARLKGFARGLNAGLNQ